MSQAPAATQPVAKTGPVRTESNRALGWLLLIGGGIGFLASFTLMVEKLHVLTDPTFVPSCSLNAVVSCTDVMMSSQAGIFGFPNPLIGIATFPILILLGALLLSAVRLPDWIWLGLQLGVVFGLVFVIWLITQALWSIEALCIYCMLVWAVVIPIFWAVTAATFTNGAMADGESKFSQVLAKGTWLWIALSWALVVVLVVVTFADRWTS